MLLNVLSRCSAIATAARHAMLQAREAGASFQGVVAGTRKTTPGFRLVEKYGLLVGGVDMHRFDLSQAVMIKDNHIDSCGSIERAIGRARQVTPHTMKIEVEVRSLEEAEEACVHGADIIMLDNFSPEQARETAVQIKGRFPHICIEVSGGISEANLSEYLGEGIDVISMGCLIQQAGVLDFSLKIQREG